MSKGRAKKAHHVDGVDGVEGRLVAAQLLRDRTERVVATHDHAPELFLQRKEVRWCLGSSINKGKGKREGYKGEVPVGAHSLQRLLELALRLGLASLEPVCFLGREDENRHSQSIGVGGGQGEGQ